ncbi:MAG: hypothetical protein Q9166_005545 [cf. Caloplaca sp. 2 TL-2023]
MSLPISALQTLMAFLLSPYPPMILTCDIPLYPPTSMLQAQEWSERYWPTIYKKYNPFGPQPVEIEKAEVEMREGVGRMMGLALRAGEEAAEMEMGVGVGVVIAEKGKVVVVAGDGRWVGGKFDCPKEEEGDREGGRGNGNPMAHAVMRAIGLVARKRRELSVRDATREVSKEEGVASDVPSEKVSGNHFADIPLTDIEQEIYEHDSIEPGGYLCLDLDIYVTHEPCVMCSMAILHSRFGKVVFGRRMPETGGMSAEMKDDVASGCGEEVVGEGAKGGLGYGLFWRPELNWRLLGWQWEDEDEDGYGFGKVGGDMHV